MSNVSLLLTISAGVPIILLLLYAIFSSSVTRKAKKLCGHYIHFLPGVPILGNALKLKDLRNSEDLWTFITACGDNYPKGVMFWLCHLGWLIVTELDIVEAVLTSIESIEKSYVYRLLDTVTDGVFSANGIRWKKLRKKLNLTFSPKQIDMLYDDLNEQAHICIETLMKNTNKEINIMGFMTPFFFDVVSRTHFGVETTEQKDRKQQVTEVAAKIIELSTQNRAFKIQNHFMFFFKRTRVYQFIDYLRHEPLIFIRQMIGQRIEEAEIEKAKGVTDERKRVYYVDGVRDVMLDLNMEPSNYNIERNSGDMLVAASDTTSVAVSAVFYYLAIYPEIQEKVYQEVLPIFGDQRTKAFTKEDINKMEYVEMVIKETLRKTAPPGIVRELSTDLDVGKYTIPKGTNVYLAMKSIHKNPMYYEKAGEFYPEHFSPEQVKNRPRLAFLPFSHGPRNCPGMTYSYITMKGIISSVVRNFKIETKVPLSDIKYKMVLMQEHKNGYFVKLTQR